MGGHEAGYAAAGQGAASLTGEAIRMRKNEQAERELEILRLLAVGEKEIEAGEGFDMEDVFAEADKLLDGIAA